MPDKIIGAGGGGGGASWPSPDATIPCYILLIGIVGAQCCVLLLSGTVLNISVVSNNCVLVWNDGQ